jgi:hypothetical protein
MMTPKIQLLKSFLLHEFPSGSSITYRNERFYVIGDDATHILVLDSEYQKLDSIHLFDYAGKRIPKADKTDLEGSVVLTVGGEDHLLIVGSASRKNRKRIILIPFTSSGLNLNSHNSSFYKTKAFVKRIKADDIEEINLEAVCLVGKHLILGNRGNRSQQENHLIVTDPDFWEHQDDATLITLKLLLPEMHAKELLGISELCYLSAMDLLLITLTSEATDNSYDDGAIGNSHLGWIRNASTKLKDKNITVDGIVDLGAVDPIFKNEKIEGICAEIITSADATLHLISDNDSGESRLFKISVVW